MYMRNAVRLTFSESGLAPTSSAAIMYQIATWAETLICCEEWPMPHHTTLYISESISVISPSDHSQVGIRMIAPLTMVRMAMIQAVSAPKVRLGYRLEALGTRLAASGEGPEGGASRSGTEAGPGSGADIYYRCWIGALEDLLVARGICTDGELATLREAWAEAARLTPHGEPILLERTRPPGAQS